MKETAKYVRTSTTTQSNKDINDQAREYQEYVEAEARFNEIKKEWINRTKAEIEKQRTSDRFTTYTGQLKITNGTCGTPIVSNELWDKAQEKLKNK